MRTCVGCRQRAGDAELLRVVLERDSVALIPDPRRSRPGRGAWLHRTPECLRDALRRRAFERALRRSGPLDGTALQAYLSATARPESAQFVLADRPD